MEVRFQATGGDSGGAEEGFGEKRCSTELVAGFVWMLDYYDLCRRWDWWCRDDVAEADRERPIAVGANRAALLRRRR